jgi:hypothetical protein
MKRSVSPATIQRVLDAVETATADAAQHVTLELRGDDDYKKIHAILAQGGVNIDEESEWRELTIIFATEADAALAKVLLADFLPPAAAPGTVRFVRSTLINRTA